MTEIPLARVILTGFMGAGKSTVGALLAADLGWRFVDIDHALVAEHGVPVAELFSIHGETGFRLLEAKAVRQSLLLDQAVIALGGGALESPSTREHLHASPGTHIVFLETPLDIALARCEAQVSGAVRPVLSDRSALESRFNNRLEHYRRAHQTLSTLNRTPAELARLLHATLVLPLPAEPSR